jgi:hypothetical protein
MKIQTIEDGHVQKESLDENEWQAELGSKMSSKPAAVASLQVLHNVQPLSPSSGVSRLCQWLTSGTKCG